MLLYGCQPEHQLSDEEYLKQGTYFEKFEQYNNAIRTYTKALEIDSFYADAYYNRGITWFDKGNLQQALADIEKALYLKPEDQSNKKAETLVEIRIKNFEIE